MCGRYVSTRGAAELAWTFAANQVDASETLAPDHNVAPTKRVPVILTRTPEDEDRDGGVPQRQLRGMRWGLVPFWADSAAIGSWLINARAETAATKPAFRRALRSRRCLIPADGYYEWHTAPGGRRQPYFVHATEPLALAGLYALWRDPQDPVGWLWSCTILTTAAAEPLAWLHHRMPLVLGPDRQAAWLDPASTDPGRLDALGAPSEALRAYPVTTEVNNPRNNGPQLLHPHPHADTDGAHP